MRLIVAGGRDYQPTEEDRRALLAAVEAANVTEIVSSGCRGVDKWGEHIAKEFALRIKRFPADWRKHGKAAGPIRNEEMAKYADGLFALPGGKGTHDMYKRAINHGLFVVRAK